MGNNLVQEIALETSGYYRVDVMDIELPVPGADMFDVIHGAFLETRQRLRVLPFDLVEIQTIRGNVLTGVKIRVAGEEVDPEELRSAVNEALRNVSDLRESAPH